MLRSLFPGVVSSKPPRSEVSSESKAESKVDTFRAPSDKPPKPSGPSPKLTDRLFSRELERVRGESLGRSPSFSRSRSSSTSSVVSEDWRVRSLSQMEDSSLPVDHLRSLISTRGRSHGSSIEEEGDDTAPGQRRRANTTNTLYLTSTLQTPDKESLLQCMSTIVFNHIDLISKKRHFKPNPKYDVFNLSYPEPATIDKKSITTINDVFIFLSTVYNKAQMEPECIVMSLVYIEKLMKYTDSQLAISQHNWRPILLICFIMASKVWDDLSMWNVDFSMICPSFTLKRINQLESHLLNALHFEVRVSSSTYAKYYFKLHTMRGLKTSGEESLDMEGARKLAISPSASAENPIARAVRLNKSKKERSVSIEIFNKEKKHVSVGLDELIVGSDRRSIYSDT